MFFSISLFELFSLRNAYPELSQHRQSHRAAPLEEEELDARSQDESHLTTLHLKDKHLHFSLVPNVPRRY